MKTFPILAAFYLLIPTAHAQERTAGGPIETQMSWSALTTLVENANTTSKAAHIRLDQLVMCGKKGALYAPGAAGADAQGCAVVNASPEIDYDACVQKGWKEFYGFCPKDMVLAGAVTRNSDTGEWNNFYCCPFKK